jgi:hypothetical protein
MRVQFSVYLACLVMLCLGSRGESEQLLVKNGGEYLGAKDSSTQFLTCHGGKLVIKPGALKNTRDKCGHSIVGPITGSIAELDVKSGRLVVNDSHGNEITFEITSAEERKLIQHLDLEVGTTIKISVGPEGKRTIERS